MAATFEAVGFNASDAASIANSYSKSLKKEQENDDSQRGVAGRTCLPSKAMLELKTKISNILNGIG